MGKLFRNEIKILLELYSWGGKFLNLSKELNVIFLLYNNWCLVKNFMILIILGGYIIVWE